MSMRSFGTMFLAAALLFSTASTAQALSLQSPCTLSAQGVVWPLEGGIVPGDGWVLVHVGSTELECENIFTIDITRRDGFDMVSMGPGAGGHYRAFVAQRQLEPGVVNINSNEFIGASFTMTASTSIPLTTGSTLSRPLVQYHPDQEGLPNRTFRVFADLHPGQPDDASVVEFSLEDPDGSNRVRVEFTAVILGRGQMLAHVEHGFSSELCVVATPYDMAGNVGPSSRACATPAPNENVSINDRSFSAMPGGCRTTTPSASTYMLLGLVLLIGRHFRDSRRRT